MYLGAGTVLAEGKEMLTKSLHTITAATKVARHLVTMYRGEYDAASVLAEAALGVLGYTLIEHADCPTVARIVANCEKILAE